MAKRMKILVVEKTAIQADSLEQFRCPRCGSKCTEGTLEQEFASGPQTRVWLKFKCGMELNLSSTCTETEIRV